MTDEMSVLIRVQTVYRVLVLPVYALISPVMSGKNTPSMVQDQIIGSSSFFLIFHPLNAFLENTAFGYKCNLRFEEQQQISSKVKYSKCVL